MRRVATSHRTVAGPAFVVTSGSCKNCRGISDDGAKGCGAARTGTSEYAGEIAKGVALTGLCHPVLLAARTCHHRPPRQMRKDHRRRAKFVPPRGRVSPQRDVVAAGIYRPPTC